MKFLVLACLGDGISSVQVVEAEDAHSARKIACEREGLIAEAWPKFKAYPFDDLHDGFFA